MRAFIIGAITFFMVYNFVIAWSVADPLIIYSTLMPLHMLVIFVVGWVFFRNKATGDVPEDLVSVVIPVYNEELLIKDVVRAVLGSSYSNIEVIAVDDGSKDNSGKILDGLAAENCRLRVIHKENGGKRTAVAAGFYAAHGEFIVLIDSDSIVDTKAIEEFMKAFSANPKVGGVVGDCKVLNADKNLLTKCQDAWYDYAFNIHKTTESTFGTVLCCSGCLAAYRRDAISHFIPFWAAATLQNSDDRDLTSYVIASSWTRKELAPLSLQLMKGMADYDDSEDRGLTANALMDWETAYIPSALVRTEVPEKPKAYIRQQTRWKKGYVRSCFFVSAFFWKKHPLMALIFYLEFMSTFLGPLVIFAVYFYAPLVLGFLWIPVTYTLSQILIGVGAGLDYKFREPGARNWKYKPLMNMIASLALPWLLVPAMWSYRKNRWMTR
jgi:hyaluronan synthase